MPALHFLRRAVLIFAVFALSAHAMQTIPEVYQDEDVTVRAGILQIGLQPVHVGDALSMMVQVEFDGRQVRLETFPNSQLMA